MPQFWIFGNGAPRGLHGLPFDGAQQAARAEQLGYDGIIYVDSQNLAGDCYVAMGAAARATERIQLGTGVTNSFTRHAAVTAGAIASVQAESGGRAHLGIGRGDSALAHLGLAPHPVPAFERYLQDLQTYLRGDDVAFNHTDVDALGLADTPDASRIRWIHRAGPKVPVDVAATGPRVIAAAARHADRVSLSVGADPQRIQWGIDTARQARHDAGLHPDIPFAAYIPIIVDDDPETALQIGAPRASLFARFSSMYGQVVGPASDDQRRVFQAIHDAYDMHHHGRPDSPQSQQVSPEFGRNFGIFGPPDYCVQRLGALTELGVDRFFLTGPTLDPTDPAGPCGERFMADVATQLQP